ncbi:MAG: COG1361 S-layer family protein [Nanoarchaeota archaeon]
MNQDPDPALAGDTVELRIGIENVGDVPINNLDVEFVPSYPFEVLQGEPVVQKLGTIQGTAGVYSENLKIMKMKVRVNRDTIAGTYQLKLKYYEEGSGAVTQATIPVAIQNRDNAEVIHIDRTALVPGREDSLQFTINNVGNAPLRDLKFYWENSDDIILPVGSDNTKYVKYIDVGESAALEYRVIADTNANPGLYKLDLYLSYDDPLTNGTKTISTIAGIYVGGETDFDVAFTQSSSGQMSFTVANIGSNPAYSVSVSVPAQRGWSVSGSNAVIIGNLNKGDYTVASFALSGSASNMSGFQRNRNMSENLTPMTNPGNEVQMQIAYTDTMGVRQVITKQVPVQTAGQTAGTQSAFAGGQGFTGRGAVQQQNIFSRYKWYFIVFAVLVLGFVGYQWYRRKKLLAEDGKAKKK